MWSKWCCGTWFPFELSRVTGQEDSGSSRPASRPGSTKKNSLHTRPELPGSISPSSPSVLHEMLLCFLNLFLLSRLGPFDSSSRTNKILFANWCLILQLINLQSKGSKKKKTKLLFITN